MHCLALCSVILKEILTMKNTQFLGGVGVHEPMTPMYYLLCTTCKNIECLMCRIEIFRGYSGSLIQK